VIPDKMLVPVITPGMKKRYYLATDRVASGGLVVLEIIAPLIGQREIISGRVTPSIERENMFDGEALCRIRFLTQTILAQNEPGVLKRWQVRTPAMAVGRTAEGLSAWQDEDAEELPGPCVSNGHPAGGRR
jgi:hypothetical protein